MKNRIASILAMILLAGCEPGILFPELCSSIEDQVLELHIDERKEIEVCFRDPDGGPIALSARSRDADIVAAHAERGHVILRGIGVGTATIQFTGTDSDGDITEESFEARVLNRSPQALDDLPEPSLLENDIPLSFNLSEWFTDPDGHELSFTIANSDPSIIRSSLTNSIMTIEFVSIGNSRIDITATDGHDSSTTSIRAHGIERSLIFRDDFNKLSNSWDYEEDFTEAKIVNGQLKFRSKKGMPWMAYMSRPIVTDRWEISMKIQNITEDMWGGIIIDTDTPKEVSELFVIFGANANLGFIDLTGDTNLAHMTSGNNGWVWLEKHASYFDEISDTSEPHILTISASTSGYRIFINDTEIVSFSKTRGRPVPMGLTQIGFTSWSAEELPFNPNGGSWIDWIEVSGVK